MSTALDFFERYEALTEEKFVAWLFTSGTPVEIEYFRGCLARAVSPLHNRRFWAAQCLRREAWRQHCAGNVDLFQRRAGKIGDGKFVYVARKTRKWIHEIGPGTTLPASNGVGLSREGGCGPGSALGSVFHTVKFTLPLQTIEPRAGKGAT